MGEYKDNNIVTVAGIVEDMPVFNHEVYKEKFYIFTLCVKRLSEVDDHIKVILSERLFGSEFDVRAGDFVAINGQFRSYNNYSGEGQPPCSYGICQRYPDGTAGGARKPKPDFSRRLYM